MSEVIKAEKDICRVVYKTVLQVLDELTNSGSSAEHKDELQQLVGNVVPLSRILASQIAPYRFISAQIGEQFNAEWMEHCLKGQEWPGQQVSCLVVPALVKYTSQEVSSSVNAPLKLL